VQQSIDNSCSPGPQQQTRRTLLQRSIDETDGRTDGLRTVTQTLPHTVRAVSTSMVDPLQSDQYLRGPRVAQQQLLSINICCLRPTLATNPLAVAAAVDRRD